MTGSLILSGNQFHNVQTQGAVAPVAQLTKHKCRSVEQERDYVTPLMNYQTSGK